MYAINYGTSTLNRLSLQAQDLYAHAPELYDVGVGIFRTAVLGSLPAAGLGLVNSVIIKKEIDNESRMPYPVIPAMLFSFGIFSLRELNALIRTWKLNKLCEDQRKDDVVLVCMGRSDPQGALNGLSSKILKIFRHSSQTHSFVIKKVSTLDDINEAIDKINQQGKRIKTMWLCGHGDPNSITLGTEELIGKDRVYSLGSSEKIPKAVDEIHFDKLDPQADIVLLSCSVGGTPGIANGLNIAEWIQFYAGPKKHVYAPKTIINASSINRSQSENGVVYNFQSFFGDITSDLSYEKVVAKMK